MSKTCTCQNISEKDKHEIKDANPSWLSPKASQLAAEVLEDRDFSSVQCMRCRIDLNAFPAAQQTYAGFHLCILMNRLSFQFFQNGFYVSCGSESV